MTEPTGPARPASRRRYSRLAIGLAFGGVAFVVIQLYVGGQVGLFPVPGGDVYLWDRVGDSIWSGRTIYYAATPLTSSFAYAPPLAVVFATVSWLPIEAQHWLLVIIRIAALRAIAGSWLGAGLACWYPFVVFDIGGGNFNLVIAASIVAAVHRRPQLAIWGALAKFGPALAVDPRDWRKAVLALGVAIAITLPWLHLWPEWAAFLISIANSPLGPQVPIPFPVRLLAAGGLLALVRRPWARALAATVAIPAFYWASLVVLLAPLAVALRGSSRALALVRVRA